MREQQERLCNHAGLTMFNAQRAAEETWEALLSAGVFLEGDFKFASGQSATLKADVEQLYSKPKQLTVVLGHFAAYPCVQDADILLYVPDGMNRFMTIISNELGTPVVGAQKKPGATSKYDFIFSSPEEKELALSATRPLIGEDVVTTLGSVAGVRKLLEPKQTVHSLAILLRGTANPAYQTGLTDHYLLVREIPTDKLEFQRRLKEEWL